MTTSEWGDPLRETIKTEAPCHSKCGTIDIIPCWKALNVQQRSKGLAEVDTS